jgi:hypothetical protein
MDRYTIDDFILLNAMLSMSFTDYFRAKCSNPNVFAPAVKAFQTEDELKGIGSSDSIIDKMIEFSCNKASIKYVLSNNFLKDYRERLRNLILEEPLDQIPRFINEPGDYSVIARWRLKIGK